MTNSPKFIKVVTFVKREGNTWGHRSVSVMKSALFDISVESEIARNTFRVESEKVPGRFIVSTVEECVEMTTWWKCNATF